MRSAVIAMSAVSFAALACSAPDAPVESLDRRTAVMLPPEAFEAVHAEMRTMLSSLHQLHMGLAAGDTALLLQGAEASGLAAAADPQLEPLLPAEFLRLGVATHTNFDGFAEAVRRGEPTDSLIVHLSRITLGCTTCHSEYHLTLGQRPEAP